MADADHTGIIGILGPGANIGSKMFHVQNPLGDAMGGNASADRLSSAAGSGMVAAPLSVISGLVGGGNPGGSGVTSIGNAAQIGDALQARSPAVAGNPGAFASAWQRVSHNSWNPLARRG
jgi:hypothetical protein